MLCVRMPMASNNTLAAAARSLGLATIPLKAAPEYCARVRYKHMKDRCNPLGPGYSYFKVRRVERFDVDPGERDG